MTEIKIYNSAQLPNEQEKNAALDFLFKHLEQYGDPREDIEKAMDYSLQKDNAPGGFVATSTLDNELVGAVVVNKTGMKGYIPENILVYIATHNGYRGKGIGKELMKAAIDAAEGDIALHVEPNNPAKFLYEKLGFTNKYLEMRLKK